LSRYDNLEYEENRTKFMCRAELKIMYLFFIYLSAVGSKSFQKDFRFVHIESPRYLLSIKEFW